MLPTFTKSAITVGAAAATLLMAASSASAFTFTTEFSPNPADSKGDIRLESVKIGDDIIKNFAFVKGATITTNTPHTGGNTGAASSDKGDNAVNGVSKEMPEDADIVASLGNPFLSSIVDTEDSSQVGFSMNLTFDKAFDKLLIWERGINSKLGIKIGDTYKVLTKDDFAKGQTGYKLDTLEIGGEQKVGSYGVDLSDFGITGKYSGPVTIFSNMYEDEHGHTNFNGPDFKVVGVAVPEPATVLGLTAIAGAFVASRRKKDQTA